VAAPQNQPVLRFAVQRLLGAIPTLLVLIALAFFLIRLAPGGPFDSEKQLPPEIETKLRAAYNLDDPLPMQLGRYLLNIAQGDFGPSFQYRDFTVSELIATGFPVSLRLGSLAMAIALLLGITAGTLAACAGSVTGAGLCRVAGLVAGRGFRRRFFALSRAARHRPGFAPGGLYSPPDPGQHD
jgi:oligopeptide transport system permease protein